MYFGGKEDLAELQFANCYLSEMENILATTYNTLVMNVRRFAAQYTHFTDEIKGATLRMG